MAEDKGMKDIMPKDEKVVEPAELQASVAEVFSFADSFSIKVYFFVGAIFAFLNGMVYPALAYIFSSSFTSITGASEADGLENVEDIAYKFLFIGTYAMACATFQTGLMEIASMKATHSFRTQWFSALLRQDQAYFDINDVSGIATQIIPNANKFRRGLGRKLGEGIQFMTTCVFGLIYAFYTSWKVSLVVLAVLPFVSFAAFMTLKINQGVTSRANEAYSEAGSIAYNTVSSIKTVLSLNAIPKMVKQYCDATEKAHDAVVGMLWKAGFTNASLLGTFICLYIALTLYGVSLLYEEVRDSGCDPSGAIDGVDTCGTSSSDVFGAMLGIAFAGQGISQVGNFFENFAAARVACYPAMQAINRHAKEDAASVSSSRDAPNVADIESAEDGTQEKIVLGDYVIDSSSSSGLKPSCQGEIVFKDVSFFYPTRPGNSVFQNFNLEVKAGTTVALVGPSGGGKSTTVSLIERFYDPTSGSVYLDQNDLRDINVKHLRNQIGLVSQEPVLFATTIAANIAYGCPGATQDQIEEAARQANAHDFIMSFPEGYLTQTGDKGTQLSGGQKQRIAIARVLIKQPKILLLDEATSALDTESEIIVQEALDKLLSATKRTTIIIAHRLSTIRNADVIAYIADGKVMEQGTHEELMASEKGLYRSLVEKTNNKESEVDSTNVSREASVNNLASLAPVELDDASLQLRFTDVSFAYPTRPDKLIFDNFNLSVRRGETLALVGPSGQGKSTAISLIERFYDPVKGTVEFEGVDMRELKIHWLRDQIGLVSQEPVLFSGNIRDNIAYGSPGATQAQIEEAAKNANAHEFVMGFKDGYGTLIGERGTQLSGGQKQRIAIARALVKDPKLLLLDESTSALDTSSEKVVQEALEKVMASHDRTTIVIAHRLSTIRNADRIAFIAGGKVKEIGTHEDLMNKPNGRYARYVESQKIRSTITATSVKALSDERGHNSTGQVENDVKVSEQTQDEKSLAKKARSLASNDIKFLAIGSIGAIGAGLVFPLWGIMFAFMIELLFDGPLPCEEDAVQQDFGFETCNDYFNDTADEMKDRSFVLALYWAGLVFVCYTGNMLTFYGYGQASERMSKRVRDSAFEALVRQEVAYFDKRSVGSITTQLQDDTALVHSFSGEPLRTLFINIASLLTGLLVSFIYMWPFALLSIGVIPFMGFATEIEMKTFLGADEGDANRVSIEGLNSPGGILVETLLNIKTVASLNLEQGRYSDYCRSLAANEPPRVFAALKAGSTSGLSMLVQQYVNALQFWWGGYLLYHYPDNFDFKGFLISMFSLLFSLFGLGAAAMGTTDRGKAVKAASRIFSLLERKSAIDPLAEGGKTL